jgi:hypothetical protein
MTAVLREEFRLYAARAGRPFPTNSRQAITPLMRNENHKLAIRPLSFAIDQLFVKPWASSQ